MVATPLTELGRRLLANVDADRGDFADAMMKVPVERVPRSGSLRARGRGRVPAQPADGRLVGRHPRARRLHDDRHRRPADRGDARRRRRRPHVPQRLPAPWCGRSPRTASATAAGSRARTTRGCTTPPGQLVGDPRQGGLRRTSTSTGLIEYPTVERAGAVFAVLTVGAELDVDDWLGDMQSALEMLAARQAPSPRRRDEAAERQLEGDRRRLPRRVSPRVPASELDRRQVDHQPQHLRPVRPARADRLRQQADRRPSATCRPRSGPTTTPASRSCTTCSRTSRSRATPSDR